MLGIINHIPTGVKNIQKRNGFTLIEIVMVIIILCLLFLWLWEEGGYGPATEIRKLKRFENEIDGITAAIYQYYDKYHVLPGDVNSDGKITGTFNSEIEGDESRLCWLHLRRTGFVGGDPNDQQQPLNPFGGEIDIATDIGGKIGFEKDETSPFSALFIGFSKVPGKYAVMVEQKRDDNNPNTGWIRAYKLTFFGETTLVTAYSTFDSYNLYVVFN